MQRSSGRSSASANAATRARRRGDRLQRGRVLELAEHGGHALQPEERSVVPRLGQPVGVEQHARGASARSSPSAYSGSVSETERHALDGRDELAPAGHCRAGG